MKLRDLIRMIRAAKTAADERAVVAKESALIRNSFKDKGTGSAFITICSCGNLLILLTLFILSRQRLSPSQCGQAAIYSHAGLPNSLRPGGVLEAGG